MTLNLTCPHCTAAFSLAEDVRGQKAFCPKCGATLFVARSGVAERKPWPRWLHAVTAPLFVLIGGLSVYVATGCRASEQTPVTKADTDQPQPAPDGKEAPKQPNLPVLIHADPPNGQAPANAQRWEYKLVTVLPLYAKAVKGQADDISNLADLETQFFNPLAKDGWEYENHIASGFNGGPSDFLIFKRPKR